MGQLDRKTFILNPNRRRSCVYASSNLLGWDFMNSKTTTKKIFVGVDVSKATLDIFRPDTKEDLQIENSDAAITEFCSELQKKKRQIMVVMEGTGGYEYLLARAPRGPQNRSCSHQSEASSGLCKSDRDGRKNRPDRR